MKGTKFIEKAKRFLASFIVVVMIINMLPATIVVAGNEGDKYPYTLFAASNKVGAITIDSEYGCINGNIATNGTVISSSNININGTKLENADEEMIDIFQKLNDNFFLDENVELYFEDYICEETNVNINSPLEVYGNIELLGNANINAGIKALNDIVFKSEVINANNTLISSQTGNIIVEGTNVSLSGLIYAPHGSVEIVAQNININGAIIIADTIKFNCSNINANYSSEMATLIGSINSAEAEIETELETESVTQAEQETESVMETEPATKTEIETEPETDIEPETKIEIETTPESETETEIETETEKEDETDIEANLYALGVYDDIANSISIQWYTNYTESSYEIWSSINNEDYILEAVVSEETTYQYNITDDFAKKYFKVSFTTKQGELVESVPFIIQKTENGYIYKLLDSDNDGMADEFEIMFGTDISATDIDGDGLNDYQEVYITNTDPRKYDSVNEGVSDSNADSDNDGIANAKEISIGTNPQNADSDEDGLSDGEEVDIHKTNPLSNDTDSDTLIDSHEIPIGLDPNNPETFDVPDAEYKLVQTIDSTSKVLSKINTVENPYKLSIDITAAGYVEGDMIAGETGYINVIQNSALIGTVCEIEYSNSESIEKVVLKFEIAEEYVNNSLNIFPDEEELSGIKRLNVFKYFEDLNMLLPIETQFDVENNLIYAETDELGTYCIMDMELWFNSFDVPKEVYKSEAVPMLMSLSSEESIVAFAGADATLTDIEECEDIALTQQTSDDIITSQDIPMLMTLDVNENVSNSVTPIDVAFLLQTSGKLRNIYISERDIITDVMTSLIEKYGEGNVRFCVVTYNLSSAEILKCSIGNIWYTNVNELEEDLKEIVYEYTTTHSDRGAAWQKLYDEVDFRENASKFIFQLINGPTTVGSEYIEQVGVCEKLSINYSEVIPTGYAYISEEYKQVVAAAIAKTNGIIMRYGYETENTIFQHICKYTASPQVSFEVIVPTGWNRIELKGMLDPNNGIDTDEDTKTDWEETYTEKISWNTDGTIILPTLKECIGFTDKAYSQQGLDRFMSKQWAPGMPSTDFQKYFDYVMSETYILPIHTDPTRKDSDDDGLLDYTEVEVIGLETFVPKKKIVAPVDPTPMKTTGPKGIWQAQIEQERKLDVETSYTYLLDFGIEESFEKEHVDWLVAQLLYLRNDIEANEDTISSIALTIKQFFEGNAPLGAYALNFIYDWNLKAYHSQVDTWQRDFGYNDLYDEIFRMGSYMRYQPIEFTVEYESEKVNYALWLWRGDYWNLQSGAEMGLYVYREDIYETKQYDAIDFELPMALSLYNYYSENKIENVFSWEPTINQWWITGFNTDFKEPNPSDMVMVGKIDFTGHEEMYSALKKEMEKPDNEEIKEFLLFDKDEHTVWIIWYEKGVLG